MTCLDKNKPLLTKIDEKEVLRYLGLKGELTDKSYVERIQRLSCEVIENASVRFEVSVHNIKSYNPITLDWGLELLGKDVQKHLEECDSVCFMAVTLGDRIDTLIRVKTVTDIQEAVILDACASAAVENVCDNLEKRIEESFLSKGQYITDRFSPGYGDFPLSAQKDICNATQAGKKMGLFCNESFLLIPVKSVTAIVGISGRKQRKTISGCERCLLQGECDFRKKGMTCNE